MVFSCDNLLLLEACNTVSKYIPAKSPVQVLEGIMFSINGEELKLTGYDMEIGIETVLEVDNEDGENSGFVIDYKIIMDILRNMNPGSIRISKTSENNILIEGGVADFNVPCMDYRSYPEMPDIKTTKSITLKQNILMSMIKQTIFAVAQNNAKPVLNGALFDVKSDHLCVVCSDTYKLAIRRENIVSEEEYSFIVPGKVLSELIKIIKNTDDDITISVATKHLIIEFEKTRINSRLIEGQYLGYENLLKKNSTIKTRVKVIDFLNSVERASVIIRDKLKVPLRCTFDIDSVVLSCKTDEGHRFNDEISAKTEGDSIEIGINNKYLAEVLTACECDEVVFGLSSPLSSIMVTPIDSNSFAFLLSPMRLK